MTSRVFLTGATGFVGTALVERLVQRGDRVTALVRASSSARTIDWLRKLGCAFVLGDVEPPLHGETGELARAMDGSDLVVHSAAVIGYRRRAAGRMLRTNVLGTRRVASAALAAGIGRLVHVSSIAAVGVTDEPRLLDEDSLFDAWTLRAPYYDTKRAAEDEVARAISAGLDATTVNPGAIYGPSRTASNSSNVVRTIVVRRPFVVPSGGINVVPLDTVVDGIVAAAEKGRTGRRYILGGENLTLVDLAVRIGRAAGLDLHPRTLPAFLGPVARTLMECVEPLVPERVWFTPDMAAMFGKYMWYDTSRAARELGVVASPLDRCLEETVAQLRRDKAIP
ncbi:MAG: NAD-dependent epimerase/dehydratase family protein [Planctomycetes bacterium]|nr:NAD-dependent epimerase/dehydratase family protein [Planctomycetota bacterium]